MQLFIFIMLVVALTFLTLIIHFVRYEANNALAASLMQIGLFFLKPLVLMWFATFLFAYTIPYWTAFMLLFAIDALTITLKETDIQW